MTYESAGQQVLAWLILTATNRPMPNEPLSWIAIGVSLTALCVSVLNYRRDRAVLQATSVYIEDWEGFSACLRVDIVNKGRRPIILDTWVGAATEGRFIRRTTGVKWMGRYFDQKNGLTLNERQPHSFQLEIGDLDYELQDGTEFIFDDIWIIDTVGRRHKIKGIRKNIASLREWAAMQTPASRSM